MKNQRIRYTLRCLRSHMAYIELGAAHSSQTAELKIRYKYARARELGGPRIAQTVQRSACVRKIKRNRAGPPRAA